MGYIYNSKPTQAGKRGVVAYKKKKGWKKNQYEIRYRPSRLLRQPVTGPDRIFRRLRYVKDDLELTGANTITGNVFCLNGMYDPDVTGIGAQPRGFDQYLTMYRNYVVLSARVKVQFMNKSIGTNYKRVSMKLSRESTIDADPIDTLEKRYVKTAILSPGTGGSPVRTLTMNWGAKRWFGKNTVLTEKDLEGNATNNPSSKAYVHIGCDTIGEGADVGVRAIVQIDYLVCFRVPTIPSQS